METLKEKTNEHLTSIPEYREINNIADNPLTIEDLEKEFNIHVKDYEFKRNLKVRAEKFKDIKISDIEIATLEGSKISINIFKQTYNLL